MTRRPNIVMILTDDHAAQREAGDRTAMIGKWHMGEGVDTDPIPLPATFHDDYATRSSSARRAAMRVAEHLTLEDLKAVPPPGPSYEEEALWREQACLGDKPYPMQARPAGVE